MGKTTRRKFTPEFKAKVALEALKESSAKGDYYEYAFIGTLEKEGWNYLSDRIVKRNNLQAFC